jgi:hypothetical protein
MSTNVPVPAGSITAPAVAAQVMVPNALTMTPAASTSVSALHIHVGYFVGIIMTSLVLWYGGHVLLQEHEARVTAEVTIKAQASAIEVIQKQMTANDAATAQTISTLQKALTQIKTPAQVISVLPQILPAPLPVPPVVNADNSVTFPAADVMALFTDLSNCKVQAVTLTGAQNDLASDAKIIDAQKTEIAALKVKPHFWARIKSDAKKVGTGVAIGAIIAAILIK